MRGTIFYTGNRMQAVENAKYYMKHKQKLKDIMLSRRQSPPGKSLTTIVTTPLDAAFANRAISIKDNISTLRDSIERSVESKQTAVPMTPPEPESPFLTESNLSPSLNRVTQAHNLHISKVHRITPSKQLLSQETTPTHSSSRAIYSSQQRSRQRTNTSASRISYSHQQSIFKPSQLNSGFKKRKDLEIKFIGEEDKINQENERLLKKIVEITYSNRRQSALGHANYFLNHQELAAKPYSIKPFHTADAMHRKLKLIKQENREFLNKLSNVEKRYGPSSLHHSSAARTAPASSQTESSSPSTRQ